MPKIPFVLALSAQHICVSSFLHELRNASGTL